MKDFINLSLEKILLRGKIRKMFDKPQIIEEIDIERHMNDNASRFERNSFVQKRYNYMQNLLMRVQGLSDKDFETACLTFESIVDTFNKKTFKSNEQDGVSKNNLSQFITTAK